MRDGESHDAMGVFALGVTLADCCADVFDSAVVGIAREDAKSRWAPSSEWSDFRSAVAGPSRGEEGSDIAMEGEGRLG